MAAKAERSLPWKCLSAPGTSSIMKRRELAVDEGGAIRALIVDDERLARRRVREMLQSDRDIEVIGEPANGPDAVMAVRESNPDLMFLDVQMPGMDGFEVLNALRDERLPMIVFITAYDQDRKSTRLNSSHANISYAVFCLKKKTTALAMCSLGHGRLARCKALRDSA